MVSELHRYVGTKVTNYFRPYPDERVFMVKKRHFRVVFYVLRKRLYMTSLPNDIFFRKKRPIVFDEMSYRFSQNVLSFFLKRPIVLFFDCLLLSGCYNRYFYTFYVLFHLLPLNRMVPYVVGKGNKLFSTLPRRLSFYDARGDVFRVVLGFSQSINYNIIVE